MAIPSTTKRGNLLNHKPNALYNLAHPDSLPVKIGTRMRHRMYREFIQQLGIHAGETLIDVGATSDQNYAYSNFIEAWYPHKDKITAVGVDDAGFLEAMYPGLRFVRASGLALPFPENHFDCAFSNAVIEHVGNRANQGLFLQELYRVARRGVCVTTPNRWFPVEFHTVLPVVHWLPRPLFSAAMRATGNAFFAEEEHLNLLGRTDIERLCQEVKPARFEILGQRLGGWVSNWMIFLWK